MYCDAKEIRFRNREELTLKSKAKTFLIDILLDIVGGCFIAIGVYNFAVASGFPVAGISGIAIVFYYFLENSIWDNDDNFEYSNYFNLLQVVGKTIFFKINKDNVNF